MRGHHLIIAVITTLVVSQLESSLAKQCFSCNSSDNSTCIANASGQDTVNCDNDCFTSTDGNGKVTRGCLASEANCTTNCQSCNTDKCNMNSVCYNCTGESCNTVTPTMYSVCAPSDGSKCYTTGSGTANMTRGCTADTSLAFKCPADTSDPSCAICDAGLCNNLIYQRSAGSCITCSECVGSQEATNGTACTLLYNQTFDGCYATEAGTRGCLASLESECNDANNCKSCTGENCNTAGQEFKCISCLSNEVSGCWNGDGTNLPSVACTNGTCFEGVWNGLGVRDCLTSGSALMQYQCLNNVEPYQCKTCSTSLCNKNSFNGAGALSQMGVVGLLLGLMVVLRSA